MVCRAHPAVPFPSIPENPMKTKLTLDPEQLSVETFQAAATPEPRGTVQGAQAASDARSCWDTLCGFATYCATSPCACI